MRQLYPAGEADTFVRHIMRVFDTDGNDFLDFKEFLMAMDISNCQTSKKILFMFTVHLLLVSYIYITRQSIERL